MMLTSLLHDILMLLTILFPTLKFVQFHPFLVVTIAEKDTKDFSPFTLLFMFIHLPLIHFAPPPRLLIDFKNRKWLLHPIMHLLLFLSPDWLTFCHVIISHINSLGSFFILFSPWWRANARNVRPYYPYWQYTDLFIFRFVSLLCLRSTLRLCKYSLLVFVI